MRTRFSINEVQGLFQKKMFVGNKAKQRISKEGITLSCRWKEAQEKVYWSIII